MAITMAQALNTALHDAMRDDDRVVVFGEDVGLLGGVFRITDKLQQIFGEKRCFDTPLAESGIVGSAVGMALYGYKPVVELHLDDRPVAVQRHSDGRADNARHRARRPVNLPITHRIPCGSGNSAAHTPL